ncbi:hypothetical protein CAUPRSCDRAFT_5050, partial [Caulochytrium protostelioides]
ASISPDCQELKDKYDTCFNNWYSNKFLQGSIESDCDHLFTLYRACVWKAIHEKNIDRLIQDARKESPFREAPADPDA